MNNENNLEISLNKNKKIAVIYKSQDYQKHILDLYKICFKKFKNIGIITFAKSCNDLIKKLQEEGINTTNTFCVDCMHKKNKTVGTHEKYINLQGQTALTELALTISELKEKNIDLIILDNLSSLLIHNDALTVLKFLNSVMTKEQNTKTKEVYIIMQKDMKGIMADINLFMDNMVEINPQNKITNDIK